MIHNFTSSLNTHVYDDDDDDDDDNDDDDNDDYHAKVPFGGRRGLNLAREALSQPHTACIA